jgi:hypothetical protein
MNMRDVATLETTRSRHRACNSCPGVDALTDRHDVCPAIRSESLGDEIAPGSNPFISAMSDPHDPDGLSAFAPELGHHESRATARATTERRGEDDWLAAFTTEPRRAAASSTDADLLAASDDDELSQFVPDQNIHHATDDEEVFLEAFAKETPVARQEPAVVAHQQHVHSSHPGAGPWAAAVIAIVISVLLGTRSLHPAWWNAGRLETGSSAVSEGQNAHLSTPPVPTLTVERGISASTLRQLGAVPVERPHVASVRAHERQNVRTAARASSRHPEPLSSSRSRSSLARAVGASPRETLLLTQRSDRAPIVDSIPLLPASPSIALRSDTVLAPVKTPVVSDATLQELGVRQALDSYERAYEHLDVAATAAVWPSVDRRALARAFETLKFQGVTFTNCAITVADANATARCRGTLEIIRKVGNSMPLTANQEWLFKMRRFGAEWKIDDVAASQSSTPATPRVHSQG